MRQVAEPEVEGFEFEVDGARLAARRLWLRACLDAPEPVAELVGSWLEAVDAVHPGSSATELTSCRAAASGGQRLPATRRPVQDSEVTRAAERGRAGGGT
jgi:hypothetical protein